MAAQDTTERALGLVEKVYDQIVTLVNTYSGDIAELALRAVAAKNIASVVEGCILIVPAFLFAYVAKYFYKKMTTESFAEDLVCAASVMLSAIATVVSASKLFSVTTWVGIFDPLLYLAMKVIP